MSYCVKCQRKTEVVNPQVVTTANNRYLLKSQCPICGTRKTQFISEQQAKQGGFLGFLGKLFGFGKNQRKKKTRRRR